MPLMLPCSGGWLCYGAPTETQVWRAGRRSAGRTRKRSCRRRCDLGAAIVEPVRPPDLADLGDCKVRDRSGRIAAARSALICALGVVLVMGPWWIRNARIYGRFVPTALWIGASLYDGLNPTGNRRE